MKVVNALEGCPTNGIRIFLAGAIDKNSPTWREKVISECSELDVTFINPRNDNYSPEILEKQTVWELEMQRAANLIVFYFPEGYESPLSLVELGLAMNTPKHMVLGVETGFYKVRYLETLAGFYARPIYYSLDKVISAIQGYGNVEV